MKNLQPLKSSTTEVATISDWIWQPESFQTFIDELNHVHDWLTSRNEVALYRGQRDARWLIDCTMARNLKRNWLRMAENEQFNVSAQANQDFQRLWASAIRVKFLSVLRPSAELSSITGTNAMLDPLFELMKRVQQYPHLQRDWDVVPGTPLVDWTLSKDVGLFFANWNREAHHAGAVYIVNATALGNVQQTANIEVILEKMAASINQPGASLPLLFCPQAQILMERANRQKARYFAQMDMRYDLSQIWRVHEQLTESRVLLKLLLPTGTREIAESYLRDHELSEEFLLPDK